MPTNRKPCATFKANNDPLSLSRDGIARCQRGASSMADQIPQTAVATPALSMLSLGMLIFVFRFDS
jgi:hypothetical protein